MARTIGIDEVGRGAWAGPLVVGAVLLDDMKPILGLTDSKLLTRQSRKQISTSIIENALAVSIGWVSANEIDELGLTAAMTLAIDRALSSIDLDYDEIIIDGNINYLPVNSRARCLIKADLTVPAVSAASIVAKVARDEYMCEQALTWTGFGFEKHVGYGTALHKTGLELHGVTPLHRLSFKPVGLYGNS